MSTSADPLQTERPEEVPESAVLWRFNSAPGIDALATLFSTVAGLQAEIDRENYMGAQEFAANAANWFATAMRNRNWGLDPLFNNAKPTGSRFGAFKQKLNALPVQHSDLSIASAWVWVSEDGPIGVCSDLPPAPAKGGNPWASLMR
jgi:hypothetical protein